MKKHQINALLRPSTYPETTAKVTLVQTHISWLFLTDEYVYKFKKPVDFGFLDFTTLEKRRFYCAEELRLNRRLSPDIYLGLAELRCAENGTLSIDGNGRPIEYAVKMVRLPEQRMMARLLEEDAVSAADISAIAHLVARFHADAARGPDIDCFGSVAMIRANWDENLRQTIPYVGRTLSSRTLEQISSWVMKRLQEDLHLLQSRVTDGFIRECDGDLHSENICLDGKVHIFDCIEFNEKFRYSDTAADVAFLAMDLENHGRRELAEHFIEEYIAASGDTCLRKVLPLYLANRAFIRGKVESFRLDDPGIPENEKSMAALRAQRLFRLARGYTLREKLPCTLFITCGPTGSGKSSLATELAFQLGIDHLASDIERKKLAGIEPVARGAAIYSDDWHRLTYQRLESLAREKLENGKSVIVDGTFIRHSNRMTFAALARHADSPLKILKLNCPPETIRKRLTSRALDTDAVSDGTWEVYQQQAALFEEPDDAEGTVIDLDARLAPEILAEQVLEIVGKTE